MLYRPPTRHPNSRSPPPRASFTPLPPPFPLQLDEQVLVFRPVLLGVAKHLLQQAHWGTNFRVGLGAFLSVADMTSDVFMIAQFLAQGHKGAALASTAFIAFNMALQMLIVVNQNSRKPRKVLLFELLLVITCVKPAMDAYRVFLGGEQDPLNMLSPLAEMTISKVGETVFEAIPSGLLQLKIFLTSEKKTAAALLSLLMSAASTGYTSAVLSYDFDTSVANRRVSPLLHGMVPDQGRGFVFFLMFMLSTLQMVSKVFSTALLLLVNPTWLAIWFSADMGLYFCYKIVRRDLTHLTPGTQGAMKYLISFFTRLGSKAMIDFSGLMLHRAPSGKFAQATVVLSPLRLTIPFFPTLFSLVQKWGGYISASMSS